MLKEKKKLTAEYICSKILNFLYELREMSQTFEVWTGKFSNFLRSRNSILSLFITYVQSKRAMGSE